MSSSSRHLIHADASTYPGSDRVQGGSGEPREPSAPVVATASSGGAVLRGRGRTAPGHGGFGRAAFGRAGFGRDGQPISGLGGGLGAGLGGSIDPVELAAHLQRLEAEAESRGYESGHARAEGELRVAVAGAGAMAARLHETAPERTADIAHAIAELALSVARRILQHEVQTDPSVLCGALEEAVATINGSPEAHVMLNPAAVEPVRQSWEALHGRAHLGKRWVFEGDPNLPAGGCSVRYEHGFVEAGLEAQLEEIGIALDRAIPALARASAEADVA